MIKQTKTKIIISAILFFVFFIFCPIITLAADQIINVDRTNASSVDFRFHNGEWQHKGFLFWGGVDDGGNFYYASQYKSIAQSLIGKTEAEGLAIFQQASSGGDIKVTGLSGSSATSPTTETTGTTGSGQSQTATAPAETDQTSAATPLKPPSIKMSIGNFSGWGDSGGWTQSGDKVSISWLSDYISVLYQYGVGIAAVLAAVMIMAGGFIWLMSAGSPDKVGKAKDFIVSALTGLFLALFSFIILTTINPRLISMEPLEIGVPKFTESTPVDTYTPNWTTSLPEDIAGVSDWRAAETKVRKWFEAFQSDSGHRTSIDLNSVEIVEDRYNLFGDGTSNDVVHFIMREELPGRDTYQAGFAELGDRVYPVYEGDSNIDPRLPVYWYGGARLEEGGYAVLDPRNVMDTDGNLISKPDVGELYWEVFINVAG